MCISREHSRQHLAGFTAAVMIFGIVLMAVGGWILSADGQDGQQQVTKHSSLVRAIAIACMTVGSFSIFAVFCGNFGACRESKKVMRVFAVMLLILLIASLTCGAVALMRKGVVKDLVKMSLLNEVQTRNESKMILLNHAGTKYGCCGIDSQSTCDMTYPPAGKCVAGSSACQVGCLNEIWNHGFKPFLTVAGVVFLMLSLVLLYGIVLSVCISRNFDSDKSAYSNFRG